MKKGYQASLAKSAESVESSSPSPTPTSHAVQITKQRRSDAACKRRKKAVATDARKPVDTGLSWVKLEEKEEMTPASGDKILYILDNRFEGGVVKKPHKSKGWFNVRMNIGGILVLQMTAANKGSAWRFGTMKEGWKEAYGEIKKLTNTLQQQSSSPHTSTKSKRRGEREPTEGARATVRTAPSTPLATKTVTMTPPRRRSQGSGADICIPTTQAAKVLGSRSKATRRNASASSGIRTRVDAARNDPEAMLGCEHNTEDSLPEGYRDDDDGEGKPARSKKAVAGNSGVMRGAMRRATTGRGRSQLKRRPSGRPHVTLADACFEFDFS
jgi:hypothetical protein